MRTGAAAGYEGYLHETALYRSDDALVGVARPFLREGIEAGEHVLVSCGERTTELLRRAVGTPPAMTFRPAEETMRRPASSIKEFRSFLASCVREGAEQIRVLGEVPHPGTGAPWGWWSRYEATVNHAPMAHTRRTPRRPRSRSLRGCPGSGSALASRYRPKEAGMDDQDTRELTDDQIVTSIPGSTVQAKDGDADGTDEKDADGTDGDATDGTDGDAKDADSTDGDAKDADATDAAS